LDHQTGIIIDPPNLPGWRNVPLKQMLHDRLGVPVILEHDAKAAALGEYHYGAGRNTSSMIYIVIGTGVGGAIILDGQLYRGTHNSSGELGHVTIDFKGDPCSCGSTGCPESFLSGPNLARRYRQGLEAGYPLPEGVLNPDEINGEMVTRLASRGDRLALDVMNTAGQALGALVASLAMILDIDHYVIGSSVAKAGDLLLEPARRAIPCYSFKSVCSRVRILNNELGDDGPLLGCAWLIRQSM
jgi:glucokinase